MTVIHFDEFLRDKIFWIVFCYIKCCIILSNKLEYKFKKLHFLVIPNFQLILYFILFISIYFYFILYNSIYQNIICYAIETKMYLEIGKVNSKVYFYSFAEQRKMSAEVRAGRPTMPTIPHSKRPTILVYPTGKKEIRISNSAETKHHFIVKKIYICI